jgi:hypothetical protein
MLQSGIVQSETANMNIFTKERIDEILYLQRKHYEIVTSCGNNPSVVQTSLAELHRLNITLSNYYDVAPAITVDNKTLSKTTGT